MARALNGDECALWFCSLCKTSGAIEIRPASSIYDVIDSAMAYHSKADPNCPNDLFTGLGFRLVRPSEFYVRAAAAAVQRAAS